MKIVTIGGGTGSFNVLQGLKTLTEEITAIISMVDDGGSTGVLRDELGVLPPGDVRQALVALSRSTDTMRGLFNYRFEEGSLKGHSFGNLFISTLEKVEGNFESAIDATSEILNIQGSVVPATLQNARLVIRYSDGEEIEGEHLIDELPFKDGEDHPDVLLRPMSAINPKAKTAIEEADVVVIAPGTLHASLIPNLVIDGFKEALAHTKGKVVLICNLVTNPGQTDKYSVSDFAKEIERFGGPVLDYVLYNNAVPPQELMDRYTKEDEHLILFDTDELAKATYTAIGDAFVSAPDGADTKGRKFIRHNATEVAAWVQKIGNGEV